MVDSTSTNEKSRYRTHSFDDPNKIRVEALKPGALNPYHPAANDVEFDHRNPITSAARSAAEDHKDAKRWKGVKEYRGWIVRNLTPKIKTDPIQNEHPDITKDSDYKMGIPRGLVMVYCPELHGSLTSMKTADPSSLPPHLSSIYDFTTKVFGSWEYLSKLKVKMFVNFELKFEEDKSYGRIIMPEGSEIPEHSLDTESEEEKRSKNPSKRDPKKGQVKDPGTAGWGINPKYTGSPVELDELGKEILNMPDPSPRPSAKAKNVYHSSVDKELLKGPSPVGYIDWTGCGGGGMCTQGHGKPAKGKLAYYLTTSERDEKGKMLVTLPSSYTTKGYGLKIHRAALEPFLALLEQARKDGIPDPVLRAYSVWRSIDDQRKSFRYYFYNKYGGSEEYGMYEKGNAKAYRRCRIYNGDPDDPVKKRQGLAPGGDHLCGRGIDMFLGIDQNKWVDAWQKKHNRPRGEGMRAFKTFMKQTASRKWLKMNAEFYGFYNYWKEPWHWAFNPDDRPKRQSEPPNFGPATVDPELQGLLDSGSEIMNDERSGNNPGSGSHRHGPRDPISERQREMEEEKDREWRGEPEDPGSENW